MIVNPIAGMGAKVGLKGTDGVLEEAIARGAQPIAPRRAVEFLQKLKEGTKEEAFKILACPGIMGEEETKAVGLAAQVLPMRIGRETSAEDTKNAARLLLAAKMDLIVFVGGDGTAKDIFEAVKGTSEVPVLGVPSGVKMYSGVFAVSPPEAAEVTLAFLEKQVEITESEILDTDEEAIRNDVFSVKLCGMLRSPVLPAHMQGSKQVSPETLDERENQLAIAKSIVEEMQPDGIYILGPGTTVKHVADLLGVEKTILGVDLYKGDKITLDLNERGLLKEVDDWKKTWIILSPIGRQGILLGRGNQQISPEIIKRVGKERIIVAATKSKLRAIEGNVLRVDTDDAETARMLKGYVKVITDYREWRLLQVR